MFSNLDSIQQHQQRKGIFQLLKLVSSYRSQTPRCRFYRMNGGFPLNTPRPHSLCLRQLTRHSSHGQSELHNRLSIVWSIVRENYSRSCLLGRNIHPIIGFPWSTHPKATSKIKKFQPVSQIHCEFKSQIYSLILRRCWTQSNFEVNQSTHGIQRKMISLFNVADDLLGYSQSFADEGFSLMISSSLIPSLGETRSTSAWVSR